MTTGGSSATIATLFPCPTNGNIPWYAAWDLAFHMLPMCASTAIREGSVSAVSSRMVHASQRPIPAYEFNFGDVNPPVHAWACWRVYKMTGAAASAIGFFWRALSRSSSSISRGGSIARTPRARPLRRRISGAGQYRRVRSLEAAAHGGSLRQADGTAWMAFYCGTMLSMALELAKGDGTT